MQKTLIARFGIFRGALRSVVDKKCIVVFVPVLVFVFVCLYICSERSASAAQRSDAPVTHIQPGQAGLAPLFLFLPYCSLCTVS